MSVKKMQLHNKSQLQKYSRIAGFIAVFAILGGLLTLFTNAASTVQSAQSGPWDSPSTWTSGQVPGVDDRVEVLPGHDVLFNVADSKINGLEVKGTLTFDPDNSTKLRTDANVIVTGQLAMVPSDPSVVQELQFVDVNPNNFATGGFDVVESDVGLWVMEDGQLYTKGTPRSGWLHMASGISSGSTSLTLESAPTGWRVGDTIVIAPNDVGDDYDDFHETTITAINGATVSFNNPTTVDHPKVNNLWTTEVMNITRNVIIGGTESGKSHTFIRSTQPQFIRYTTFEHMGPRNTTNLKGNQTGRYGLHMHHSGNGSDGSIVEGTVITKTDNHAYVTHESHGVTLRDTISYDTLEDAYWWDDRETTHEILYDHAIAAKVDHYEPDGDKFQYSGFFIARGNGNAIRNSVGVGIKAPDGGAFFWNSGSVGLWEFDEGNISHNNRIGMRVWQNTSTQHTIRDLVAYYNQGPGVVQGAYTNNYMYERLHLYGNAEAQFEMGANSRSTAKMRVFDSVFDGGGISPYGLKSGHSAVPGEENKPVEFRNIEFKGYTDHAIFLNYDRAMVDRMYDIIDPTFENNNKVKINQGTGSRDEIVTETSWVRLQEGNTATKIQKSSTSTGPRVAPTIWGDGTGLLTSWFDDTNLQDFIVSELYTYIEFDDDELTPPHQDVDEVNFSVRFEGEIQPQFSETYTFHALVGDGHRLTIDGQPVIDSWQDQPREFTSGTIDLVAGQKYSFVFEGYESNNNDAKFKKGNFDLEWESPSTLRALIPTTQLYPKLPLPLRDPTIAPDPQLPPYLSGTTPPADTTNPTVTLTTPITGAAVTGSATLSANAIDNIGIARVEFMVLDQVVGTDTTAPYSISWDSTALADGSYTMSAKATDTSGNTTTSNPVTVTIDNSGPVDPPSTSDLNNDGVVNVFDLSILLNNWSTSNAVADINGDGIVNVFDLSIVLSNWTE